MGGVVYKNAATVNPYTCPYYSGLYKVGFKKWFCLKQNNFLSKNQIGSFFVKGSSLKKQVTHNYNWIDNTDLFPSEKSATNSEKRANHTENAATNMQNTCRTCFNKNKNT